MQTVSDTFKTKINADTRMFHVKCEIYFDGDDHPPTLFEGDQDIAAFTLLEEAYAESISPLGALSSNEFTLALNNREHRFTTTNTASPFYGKLIPNIKVIAYLGLEVSEDTFEYVNLGTFRSQDWDTTSSDIEVSTVCHDRLYDLGQLDCPPIPVIQNTTLKDMFIYLFRSLGLSNTEYEVDNTLSYSLKYGWFPNGKVKDALQQMAEGGSCLIYVSRDNKIKVRNTFSGYTRVGYIDDQTQVISASIPQKYLKIYNQVGVTQKTPFIRDVEQILKLDKIVIEPGTRTLSKIEFSTGPIAIMSQVQCSNGVFTKVKSFTHTAWNTTIVIENTGPTAETIDIIAYGQKIEFVDTEATVQIAVDTFVGERKLTINNMYIQSDSVVKDYAARILQFVSDPGAYVEVSYRGNPAIELWDVLLLDDTADKITGFEIVPLRNSLDFDGSLTAKMTALRQTTKSLNDWCYVCPGLYIYSPRKI